MLSVPAALGVGIYLHGSDQDHLLRQNEAFSQVKKRFTSLARSAISEDDWQVPLIDLFIEIIQKHNEGELCHAV